jgi:hypothetical protein
MVGFASEDYIGMYLMVGFASEDSIGMYLMVEFFDLMLED